MNLLRKLDKLSKKEYPQSKPTLQRIKDFLNKISNPQKKLKNIIHITGTNGKGSVANFISKFLTVNNYAVGLYTSPHLLKFNERIVVNSKMIEDETVEKYLKSFLKLEPNLFEKLTYFEVLTALAFSYFADSNLDFCVIEVGLGGKYDATNVIENTKISIIVSIHYDHTELLGKKLSQIAEEKSGIIKENSVTICGDVSGEPLKVILNEAKQKKSRIYLLGKDFSFKLNPETRKDMFSLTYYGIDKKLDLTFPKQGLYQLKNLPISLAALEVINSLGFKIDFNKIKLATKSLKVPMRFTVTKVDNKTVILDVAHNEAACIALRDTINSLCKRKVTLIMGVLREKRHLQMVKALLPIAKKVLTITPNSIRALKSTKLKQIWNKLNSKIQVFSFKNFPAAWKNIKDENLICITGSFYTVSDALKTIKINLL